MIELDGMLDPFRAENAIDMTAFLGTWPWRLQASAGPSDLGALADRLDLAGLCVSHLGSVFGFDTRSGNEALWDAIDTDDRLWPFAILNPTEPKVENELAWATTNGARGVRLTPGYHGYHLSEPPCADLVAAVREAGLPLHVCVRLDDERLRHHRFRSEDVPIHELAELIRAHPGQPLVLSGLRSSEWDAVRAHLDHTDDTSHVIVDLWYVNGPAQVVQRICAQDQVDHYVYGSATPVQSAMATALQLATADIAPADRRKMCRGSAERVLTRSGP